MSHHENGIVVKRKAPVIKRHDAYIKTLFDQLQSSPETEIARNMRPRICRNVTSAVQGSLPAEKLQIHLRVLSNIPVELDFFKETACEVIKICAPERQFESAVLDDLVRLLKDEGAGDEKIKGAAVVLRHALRDYLNEKFLARIGSRLKGIGALKEEVVKIVDAARNMPESSITESFKKDLLELFDKHLEKNTTANFPESASNTEVPELRRTRQADIIEASVPHTERSEGKSQGKSTMADERPAQKHPGNPDPQTENNMKPSANGSYQHETHEHSIDELIAQERLKSGLPTTKGKSQEESAMANEGHAQKNSGHHSPQTEKNITPAANDSYQHKTHEHSIDEHVARERLRSGLPSITGKSREGSTMANERHAQKDPGNCVLEAENNIKPSVNGSYHEKAYENSLDELITQEHLKSGCPTTNGTKVHNLVSQSAKERLGTGVQNTNGTDAHNPVSQTAQERLKSGPPITNGTEVQNPVSWTAQGHLKASLPTTNGPNLHSPGLQSATTTPTSTTTNGPNSHWPESQTAATATIITTSPHILPAKAPTTTGDPTGDRMIRGAALLARTQGPFPTTNPAQPQSLSRNTSPLLKEHSISFIQTRPAAEVQTSNRTPRPDPIPTKPKSLMAAPRKDKDITCWYWLNARPACHFQNPKHCPYAHALKDYVQDRSGGAPTKAPTPNAAAKYAKSLNDASMKTPTSLKREAGIKRKPSPSPPRPNFRSTTSTPLLDTFWPPHQRLRPSDQSSLCDAIVSGPLSRARGNHIVTQISVNGRIRDYDLYSGGGLRTKLGGLVGACSNEKEEQSMRAKLEDVLRPLIDVNREVFPGLDRRRDSRDSRNTRDRDYDELRDGEEYDSEYEYDATPSYRAESPQQEYRRTTCRFWYSGYCRNSAEKCAYAHEDMGLGLSAPPQRHR